MAKFKQRIEYEDRPGKDGKMYRTVTDTMPHLDSIEMIPDPDCKAIINEHVVIMAYYKRRVQWCTAAFVLLTLFAFVVSIIPWD